MDWEAFFAVTGTITGILGGAAAIRRGHRQEDTEAALAYMGTAVLLSDVNWLGALSAGCMGAAASVLMAVAAGIPEAGGKGDEC